MQGNGVTPLRRACLPIISGRRAAARGVAMNRYEGGGEAVIEYLDSNIRVIRPGSYVRCAVTGQAIPLDQLKYWSVERQEAYASPEAVMKRLGVTRMKGTVRSG
jgi:hypothetical protein